MVKTIKIGERDVRFDTSLAWMFKYRTQFGHDPIDVIMPAIKAAIPLVEIEGDKLTIADLDLLTDILGELNFTEALQLIWALAANGDKEIDDPATKELIDKKHRANTFKLKPMPAFDPEIEAMAEE